MRISQFNRIFYKKNINIDFYLFCLKKDLKLIRFLFINLYNLILSYLFVSKKDIFEIKKFNYLKYVKNLDKCLRQFAKTHKVNDYFDIKPNVIIDNVPVIFIKKYFKNVKIIGYEFDNDYNIDLIKYKEELLMIKQVDCLYLSNYFSFNCIDSRYYYVVSNKKIRYLTKKIKNID